MSYTPITALKPTIALLSKIGSVVVHADEMMSSDGHHFDRIAIQQVLNDQEVQDWIKAMGHYSRERETHHETN